MKPLFWIVLTICVSATAAERVASLSPNLTETVVRLGAEDQLVGRSSACDYPESVRKLPVVGRFGVPALEPLLATRPTLVIAETLRNDADAERLRELGVRLEAFPAVTVDDYFRNLARLGALLGKEKEAREEAGRAKQLIAAWKADDAALTEKERPKVLVIIGVSPVVTAGKNSFLTPLIKLAGGRNVAGKVDKNYFSCSFEQVVLWQPEVILAPGLSPELLRELKKSPGWDLLPAVKNGRVVTGFDAGLAYRLGPRTFDGIAQLREILRPPASVRHTQPQSRAE